MISKTKIKERTKRKTNPELIETINIARKKNLIEIAKKLSGPSKHQKSINLKDLNQIKEKNIIVIGKVLSVGEIKDKKIIIAISFSKSAIEKLKNAGCELRYLNEEIKKIKDLNEFKIIL